MPTPSTDYDALDGAKREITGIAPKEVSLVDIPANLEVFAIRKNQAGAAAPAAPAAPATPAASEAVGAIVKDLSTQIATAFADLKTAISGLAAPAPAAPAPAAAAPAPTPVGGAQPLDLMGFEAAVTKNILGALREAGVIKAPMSPVEQVAGKLDILQGGVTEAFGKVTKALGDLATRVDEMSAAPAAAPVSQQPGTPASPVAPVTAATPAATPSGMEQQVTKITIEKDLGKDTENLVSSMLFGGLGATARPRA